MAKPNSLIKLFLSPKKAPAPAAMVQLEKTTAPAAMVQLEKTPKIKIKGDAPDIGETDLEEYSNLEKAIQTAEDIEEIKSNVAAGAGTGALIMKGASPLVSRKLGSVARVAGRGSVPAQVAFWGIDGVRAAADPEYQEEVTEAYNKRMYGPDATTDSAVVSNMGNAAARPISTFGAMTGDYLKNRSRIKAAEEASEGMDFAIKLAQDRKRMREQRERRAQQIQRIEEALEVDEGTRKAIETLYPNRDMPLQ